jgi:nonribosomal peptide synthetase DhbF
LEKVEDAWAASAEEVYEYLAAIGGFEGALDAGDRDHVLRVVRHDALSTARYFHTAYSSPRTRLRTPVYCILGDQDPVTEHYQKKASQWDFFAESVEPVVIRGGGHYFVKHQASELARIIVDRLGPTDRAAGRSGAS